MTLFQAIAAVVVIFLAYYTLIYLVVVVFMGQGQRGIYK